jgi:uncharacterized protein YjbJ (UPF0337 family)
LQLHRIASRAITHIEASPARPGGAAPVIGLEDRGMAGKTDQAKGRAKQAAGVLVGDEKLENEGKVDRAAGKIKEKTGEVVDKVKSALKRRR